MSQVSLIPEEIKKLVGQEIVEPLVTEVEKGAIRKFAQAMEDPNPLWQDEEYAKKTKSGSIMAPPLFLCGFGFPEYQAYMLQLKFPGLNRGIADGLEIEYFQPVFSGDTITVTTKIVEISEKESRLGKMVSVVTEMTYTNQNGEVVAKQRMGASRY